MNILFVQLKYLFFKEVIFIKVFFFQNMFKYIFLQPCVWMLADCRQACSQTEWTSRCWARRTSTLTSPSAGPTSSTRRVWSSSFWAKTNRTTSKATSNSISNSSSTRLNARYWLLHVSCTCSLDHYSLY